MEYSKFVFNFPEYQNSFKKFYDPFYKKQVSIRQIKDQEEENEMQKSPILNKKPATLKIVKKD